jgi:AcrR family transcriptional regulator
MRTATPAPLPDADDVLLDAAARLFREKGYPVTTLRQIARAADVLPGSIFYRFRTKEALLVALMERAVVRMTSAVQRAIAKAEGPMERMRAALAAHTAMLVSDDASLFVLLYDWRFLGRRTRESLLELRDQYDALWDDLLRKAAEGSTLKPNVNLKLLRMLSFGAVNWVAQWYSPKGPLTPAQIADAFWSYMAYGVLEAPPRPRSSRA